MATVSGRMRCASQNVSTCSVNAGNMSRCSTTPGSPLGGSPCSVSARTSRRPLSSPTGRAPDRQNFSPLYCFGLWLAVIITAGRSSDPDAKYRRSVEASPRSTTSEPREVMPSEMAAARSGDEIRQSRPTTTFGPPANSANAAPILRARSSSRSSGNTPRTSYALKMRSRSPTVTNRILRRRTADRQAGWEPTAGRRARSPTGAARPFRRGTTISPRRGDTWRTRARGRPRSW